MEWSDAFPKVVAPKHLRTPFILSQQVFPFLLFRSDDFQIFKMFWWKLNKKQKNTQNSRLETSTTWQLEAENNYNHYNHYNNYNYYNHKNH